MDYPNSDEEFEIMHAAEIEAMREMEEEESFSPPAPSCKPKSKRSLDFGETSTPSTSKKLIIAQTPQEISQISVTGSGSVASANDTLESSNTSVGCTPLDQPSKRTIEELFGDISDVDFTSASVSSENKRPRLEDEFEMTKEMKQDILINKIIEMRKKAEEFLQPLSTTSLSSKFKQPEDCITTKVPQWPFMPVCGFGDQRIYLRLRSEEFFTEEVTSITQCTKGGNLLSMPYSELKFLAQAETAKMQKRSELGKKDLEGVQAQVADQSKDLLVERYKPKSYLELLSDEGTNRSLLQWLKLWDKVVFGRNVIMPKHDESHQNATWKGQRFQSKNQSQLNMELDDTNRPQAKVALLCGPPGLGKTTLAHLIALQAGYNVVEVNASDDRSPQAFRIQLEAATQMKAVMGEEKRPNCLILDEIDGAPSAAIDVLVAFATDKEFKKGKGKKKAGAGNNTGMLRRPIICICNDVYVPALRPLRQIAFTLHFPPTSSARLAGRLVDICRLEGVKTDVSSMMALGEKTNNDIRACMAVLHCIKAKTNKLSLSQIQNVKVGIKDMQQGLFNVWQAIFQITKPKPKVYVEESFSKGKVSASPSDRKSEGSIYKARMAEILRVVHGCGDYDRLVQGVYENFPLLNNNKTISFSSLALSLKWFTFHDIVSKDIYANQNYVLYPYLLFGFVAWHFAFATFAWPKLTYPHVGFEMNQRSTKLKQLMNYCIEGSAAHVKPYITKDSLLLDCIPYLLNIINPNLRTVSSQLLTFKEKESISQVVSIMIDYNLNYTQERNQEGVYTYNLDPNIEEIGRFPDWKAERTLSYAGKQMISHEIEVEKMRRAEVSMYKNKNSVILEEEGIHTNGSTPKHNGVKKQNQDLSTPPEKSKEDRVPSHLQKLTPKAFKKNVEKPTRDFFGRVVEKKAVAHNKVAEDEIVKSDIWFYFKEGHNNAVRKTLYIDDLLKPSKWNSF